MLARGISPDVDPDVELIIRCAMPTEELKDYLKIVGHTLLSRSQNPSTLASTITSLFFGTLSKPDFESAAKELTELSNAGFSVAAGGKLVINSDKSGAKPVSREQG